VLSANDKELSSKTCLKKTAILRWSILGLAVVLIVAGLMQDDALAVFRKAILICYECSGIG
jgi:hypothetical protein